MNKWFLTSAVWVGGVLTAFGLNTKATLVLADETVVPGQTTIAGVVLEMNPGWHIYWRNPGESGMATEIDWKLPEGVSAGPIEWPVPEAYESDGLVTYILKDTATLLVPLKFSKDLQSGPLSIEADVSWLECEVLCVPGDAKVSATVVVGEKTKLSPTADLIFSAQSRLRKDGSGLNAQAAWEAPPDGDERALLLEWPVTATVDAAEFFPNAGVDYEIRPGVERLPVDKDRVALRALVKKYKGDWPKEIGGVLVTTFQNVQQAFEIQLPIQDADNLPTAAATLANANSAAHGLGSLPFYLLLGLGGGLILNLMPCVLPILSLKVLSLVRQGGSAASERRKHGIIYTMGVLSSFWIIAGLVIAGQLASWGAQFQDPRFVVAVTVLMTLVALNLFGVFEVILPGSAVTGATQLASREGASGAFFNGVLAVVLGASCVAPLLAPAIGWAVSQTPLVIVLVFSMIGLGLALPFLLLSFFPSLQHLLPKPGPWMEKFKILMGFPMLATAAWLLSQTADHFGTAGPLWVGLFLVLLSLALWIYGEFVQRGHRRKGLAAILALLIAVGGYAWTLEARLDWRHQLESPTAGLESKGAAWPEGVQWEPWSAEAVEAARMDGKPVLVDFTANWCLTCNTIVKPALEKENVAAKLQDMNAVALIADFTRRDPNILAELRRFQRAGVPLVIVYPASSEKPPIILPDPNPLLGITHYSRLILDGLEQAAR